MNRIWALIVGVLASPVWAESFPNYADVTGVAANDVLNLRQGPDVATPIIGMLPPDATWVEVTGRSPDGRWLRLNAGESVGWAAARYLNAVPMPAWWSERVPLACGGVEPFWRLSYAPGALRFDMAGEGGQDLTIDWGGPTAGGTAQTLGWRLSGEGTEGFAVLKARDCTDGMSERVEAIGIDLFLRGPRGEEWLTGCCRLN
jgi:uncharacterized membrane protein